MFCGDVNIASKVINKKIIVVILKVNDENSRIRISLSEISDPWIQIRTKMSRICNTAS
jgi:hypothetical protein